MSCAGNGKSAAMQQGGNAAKDQFLKNQQSALRERPDKAGALVGMGKPAVNLSTMQYSIEEREDPGIYSGFVPTSCFKRKKHLRAIY